MGKTYNPVDAFRKAERKKVSKHRFALYPPVSRPRRRPIHH
ncbi:hypothetical protein EON67_01460, partial [archaeon]